MTVGHVALDVAFDHFGASHVVMDGIVAMAELRRLRKVPPAPGRNNTRPLHLPDVSRGMALYGLQIPLQRETGAGSSSSGADGDGGRGQYSRVTWTEDVEEATEGQFTLGRSEATASECWGDGRGCGAEGALTAKHFTMHG